MRSSEEQLQQFETEGYLLLPGMFSPADDRLDELIATGRPGGQ